MATGNDNQKNKWEDVLVLAHALSAFLNPPADEWQDYILEFSATRKEDGVLLIDKVNMYAKQQG